VKLVAALVLATAVLAAGAGAKGTPVLGLNYAAGRLAWYDLTSLQPVAGRKVPMKGACSWAFSANRATLAYSDCRGALSFVNTRPIRVAASMNVTGRLAQLSQLAWPRADRLLGIATVDQFSTLVVIDPTRRRVVRRVDLPGLASGRAVLHDGRVAYLVTNAGTFGPARVAVADAEGNVRFATLDRISAGSVFDEESDDRHREVRAAGFAVDVDGGRAFVASPGEPLLAEVDLRTLEVSYHGPARSLSKAIDGSVRSAVWLGGGMLAVSGADYETTGTGSQATRSTTPYGLHLIDTRSWSARTVDSRSAWLQKVPGGVVATLGDAGSEREVVAWAADGTVRYRISVGAHVSVDVWGPYALVCEYERARKVLDAASGAVLATPPNAPCVALLDGSASSW
jgi:hypothetical protein